MHKKNVYIRRIAESKINSVYQKKYLLKKRNIKLRLEHLPRKKTFFSDCQHILFSMISNRLWRFPAGVYIYIYPIKWRQSINSDGFLRAAITSTFALYQNLAVRSRNNVLGVRLRFEPNEPLTFDKPKLMRLQ